MLLGIRYLKDEVTMLPKKGAKVLLDKNYIMACAGVLSRENKEVAKALLIQSLGITVRIWKLMKIAISLEKGEYLYEKDLSLCGSRFRKINT